MSSDSGERRVPLWLVLLVVLAYIPAGTFAMTMGALLGSSGDDDQGGSGDVSCKGVKAGKYQSFFEGVLEGIEAPVSDAHITGLAAWHKAEGGTATWNPLNTTQPASGATDYNSVGVKNYPNESIGVSATIKTLVNGNYPKILEALRAETFDIQALGTAVDSSVWGTKHLSDVAGGCTNVQAAGDYSKGCPRFERGTPWGGRSNGAIPEAGPQMIQLPGSMNGQWLRCDAGKSFIALSAEFKKKFGHDISVTDGYRTLAEQRALYASKGPGLAATPGRSNHGWGCAVDLGSGINQFNSAQFRWMKANSTKYGWVHPAWAEASQFEPWHWEFQYCSGTKAA